MFELIEFNVRRLQRGAEAARVSVTYEDGTSEWLWMSKKDIQLNLKEFGADAELLRALDCYKQRRFVEKRVVV